MARDAKSWAGAIRDEVGKPYSDALAELVAVIDAIGWTARHGKKALRDERITPGRQRFLLVGSSVLRWRPIGVVGMIGTWNYPLVLNAPTIAQAIFAGNSVVWKPSEFAPLIGEKLGKAFAEAGLPEHVLTIVQGFGDVGAALMDSAIDKALFTGGIENGRRVLGGLGHKGIPAAAELSGFDAAIVLPEAPFESTVNALAWASFVGAGQTCIAVKRVYVVGDPLPWAEALAKRAKSLRVGNPASDEIDLGPMISEVGRTRFDASIRAAEVVGARLLTGGRVIDGPGFFYTPTVLQADTEEPEAKLAGCFGPVVLVRGFPSADAALEAANASSYGLAASVWGKDRSETRRIAERLEVGMVMINDAVTPSAHRSSPFGGIKASGYGRTKGDLGLREFVHPQTLQTRSPGGFRPQIFPYSRQVVSIMNGYLKIFHR
jgi:acyl-CoA reductase-like NAD-dependent aldehyde dehydrogenase